MSHNSRWTKEEIDRFAALWRAGMNYRHIAEELGRTPGTVHVKRVYLFRDGDERFAPRAPAVWRENRDLTYAERRALEMERVQEAAVSLGPRPKLSELAEAAGLSRTVTMKRAKALGIVFANSVNATDEIKRLAEAGLYNFEIAARLGYPEKSVHEITSRARRLGIAIPYEHERGVVA